MEETEDFVVSDGFQIKYRHLISDSNIAVVFCHGLKSCMFGNKGDYLLEFCKLKQLDFLRFDYKGHGISEGVFSRTGISDYIKNTLDVITKSISPFKSLIIIGSSIGGWVALRVAETIPDRIKGLILMAPAPDFSEIRWAQLSNRDRERVLSGKFTEFQSPYMINGDNMLGYEFFSQGRQNLLFQKRLRSVPLTNLFVDPQEYYEHALLYNYSNVASESHNVARMREMSTDEDNSIRKASLNNDECLFKDCINYPLKRIETMYPIRILHGDADDCVPLIVSKAIVTFIDCPGGVKLEVVLNGDHRLSSFEHLSLLGQSLEQML
mmetsp:Transcript_21753/g.38854  ORF Transcript_21753/g.38854 Transcript_21753/m.38854 type:complete len:323 (-) Transcript_21753:148-1116(-)